MKKFAFLLMAMVIMLSIIPVSPAAVFADDSGIGQANIVQPEYPTELNGVPVFFVQSAANTVGFDKNEVVLVFMDSKANDPEEVLVKLNNNQYLEKNPLPQGWRLEIYTGWDASREEFIKAHERTNEARKHAQKYKLLPPSAEFEPCIQLKDLYNYPRSYTVCANRDPETMNILSQSARWTTPSAIGANPPNLYCAMLNNAIINTSQMYLLQVGQDYYANQAFNLYAYGTRNNGLNPQYFANPAPDIRGHQFEFKLYRGTSYWNFYCKDLTAVPCYLASIPNLPGTRIWQANYSTGIFFENYNTDGSWDTTFSPQNITVFNAMDGITSTPNQNWGSVYKKWQNCSLAWYDASSSMINGTLANGGQAAWNLPNLPVPYY